MADQTDYDLSIADNINSHLLVSECRLPFACFRVQTDSHLSFADQTDSNLLIADQTDPHTSISQIRLLPIPTVPAVSCLSVTDH